MGMYALSIRQPWAELIVRGYKDVENRNWRPSRETWEHIRGTRLAIHAGKTLDRDIVKQAEIEQREAPGGMWEAILHVWPTAKERTGGIIGTAKLEGIEVYEKMPGTASGSDDVLDRSPSPWAFGPYGWVFSDPEILDEVIPYKGSLGLFRIDDPKGDFPE